MIYYIAIGIIILIFWALPVIRIQKKFSKELRDSFRWLVKYGHKRLPFSTTKEYGMGKGLMYCPHPFTNWSLNPSYHNRDGHEAHTIEGFRKASGIGSIVAKMNESPGAYKIVCVGGSGTYCNYIEDHRDTWPAKLETKVNKDDLAVFNFGVGHWSTIQSLIRCVTWLPIVKPDLLIFYQAKNDLSALYDGAEKEEAIFPDYQNVMSQFSEVFSFRFPRWALRVPFFSFFELRRLEQLDFWHLYKPKAWTNPRGFNRLTDSFIDSIIFRVEMIIMICAAINCKVIYIPEIVRNVETDESALCYVNALDKIYGRVPPVIKKYPNASFFDARGLIPDSDRYFFDKMHFNKDGCELFSDLLARYINTKVL
jgi:hypothetical protein